MIEQILSPRECYRHWREKLRIEPFIGLNRDSIEVIDHAGVRPLTQDHIWVVRCNCGNEFESDLKNYKIRDCGCGCDLERRLLRKLERCKLENARQRITYKRRYREDSIYREKRKKRCRRWYETHKEEYHKLYTSAAYKERMRERYASTVYKERKRAYRERHYKRYASLTYEEKRRKQQATLAYRERNPKIQQKIRDRRKVRSRESYQQKKPPLENIDPSVDRRTLKRPRSKNKELSGRRQGKLTILDYVGGNRWNVKCDCGKAYTLRGIKLKTAMRCVDCYKKESTRKSRTSIEVRVLR